MKFHANFYTICSMHISITNEAWFIFYYSSILPCINTKISIISSSHRMWSFRNCCFYSLIRGKFFSSNNTHDIRKETIVMDPMCMDERILCCTHSVTGIFMGSNNTVWQLISSICSFIPCSKKVGNSKE